MFCNVEGFYYVAGCTNMLQDVLRCSRMYYNITTCSRMLQGVLAGFCIIVTTTTSSITTISITCNTQSIPVNASKQSAHPVLKPHSTCKISGPVHLYKICNKMIKISVMSSALHCMVCDVRGSVWCTGLNMASTPVMIYIPLADAFWEASVGVGTNWQAVKLITWRR